MGKVCNIECKILHINFWINNRLTWNPTTYSKLSNNTVSI